MLSARAQENQLGKDTINLKYPPRSGCREQDFLRDHAQITTTQLVAIGIRNPSVSVPPNREAFDGI